MIDSSFSNVAKTEKQSKLQNLTALSFVELINAVLERGLPKYRAKQIWGWIWRHGITDFQDMSNIAKSVRTELSKHFVITRPAIIRRQKSSDGTLKWLIRLVDGQEAETVYIPEEDRGTLCISSQVGCTLTCSFCHTGTQRLVRNLSVDEICGQILLAMDELGDWPSGKLSRRLTNVVLMGMGEPLFNYDNVAEAIKIIMSGDGIAISKRRITLSTAGIVPEIARCGEELGVNLAISLHAVTDTLRNELVPINKKYNLEKLINAVRNYPSLSNARRVTWEYVMLDGVNDSPEDAKALIKLISGIPSKINLIPFNPWPGSRYDTSKPDKIEKFAAIILNAGYASPIRTPRGSDILAACGQLKSDSVRLRARERA